MCRFVLYRGADITLSSLVTEPANSLIHQSFQSREREEPLNGDGFGIAWYVPEMTDEPAMFRSLRPAWNNDNLRHLARVTRSPCILAHVRAATPGMPVTVVNCHPFSWGPFAFMHNGHVGGYRRIRRRLLGRLSDESFELIEGSTDSEHVFALFVERYQDSETEDPAERIADAVAATILEVEEMRENAGIEDDSELNLAVSDGRSAVVSRYKSDFPKRAPSLYFHTGTRYECDGDLCGMVDSDGGRGAVIISSERLSEDPGWDRVPSGHMVVVREDTTVDVRPIEA
jgi:ergothioneine biosynthesis protein EgtC